MFHLHRSLVHSQSMFGTCEGGLSQNSWLLKSFSVTKDWTLCLDDKSPNHKESDAITQELEYVTGIVPRTLVALGPGMRSVREKPRWASTCHHVAGRHCILIIWHFWHSPSYFYGEKK
ncbi:uncharacterized protein EDB91DRAFT_1166628 [Suillus paluster]|uniref:uncharacterized protein n=1 Tax=Suillus paluster TaxID=48578 RepID=UPI001B8693DD|nr:uncharacterized protein EDB91DRAFT_1166628 [Suillus paluster]KAG1726193.1 hypothetical protein EDB91DRAFT_1166628 [Suillus paluster]